MAKQTWPAPERNKQPIVEVLLRVLPPAGSLLEIASGSGQHAAYFAQSLPTWRLLPSDLSPENIESIRAWVQDSALPNLELPRRLDVMAADWDVPVVDAIFCANMVHIAPWECAVALFAGASRHLRPRGWLVLYGPFHVGGQPTSPSNADFDLDLRRRNPSWGVRHLEEIEALGSPHALELTQRVAMPANNQILVFERRP